MNAIFVLTVLAGIWNFGLADNSGCPHPNEARYKILEQILVATAPTDGRNFINVDVPRRLLGQKDISCISVVARQYGSTPDLVSFGRNKNQGYSIIIHSRLRNPLNATLFIYTE